jgi:hypothetical protein
LGAEPRRAPAGIALAAERYPRKPGEPGRPRRAPARGCGSRRFSTGGWRRTESTPGEPVGRPVGGGREPRPVQGPWSARGLIRRGEQRLEAARAALWPAAASRGRSTGPAQGTCGCTALRSLPMDQSTARRRYRARASRIPCRLSQIRRCRRGMAMSVPLSDAADAQRLPCGVRAVSSSESPAAAGHAVPASDRLTCPHCLSRRLRQQAMQAGGGTPYQTAPAPPGSRTDSR